MNKIPWATIPQRSFDQILLSFNYRMVLSKSPRPFSCYIARLKSMPERETVARGRNYTAAEDLELARCVDPSVNRRRRGDKPDCERVLDSREGSDRDFKHDSSRPSVWQAGAKALVGI
ncbi:unnamed protein product [Phytophthora fragariaefolia]|uniref:Unnamed protein product n=1 Tax=Phytophthora fragariaefolia TaxID=1490495 RepID=A0A9W6WTJ9_9STRA|nr:unnamed protein product [Phytophthora fragariaefolia]